MSAADAISRAIAFTERHLRLPVTVAQMADAAPYSLYHFCRVFGTYVRHTPYDYLMRRRMTLAAGEVVQTDRRIVDIACDFQFDSHEGFTRAFHRMFALSPTDARRQGWVPATRRLPRLTADHLACLRRHDGLFPQYVSLPEHVAAPAAPTGTRDTATWLAVRVRWPDPTPTPAHQSVPAGEWASFVLLAADDLPLVLDWILHAWLFHAPCDLRHPVVIVDHRESARILVPVRRQPTARASSQPTRITSG